jgi:hypothetical protein
VKKLAVATPFNEEFNARLKTFLLKTFLEQTGFAVRGIRSLGIEYQDLVFMEGAGHGGRHRAGSRFWPPAAVDPAFCIRSTRNRYTAGLKTR